MKRIILMATILSMPLLAMQKDQELKRPAEEEIAAGSKKAKLSSSPARLLELSLQAILKHIAESEEEIIPFVERAIPIIGDSVCLTLIKKYVEQLDTNKRNDTRLSLASYCACKAMDTSGANPLLALKEKTNPFAKLACLLIEELLNDEAFEDRAALQPFTLICMRSADNFQLDEDGFCFDSKKGYELLRAYMYPRLDVYTIRHTVRQLIMYDEHAFLALLDFFLKRKDALELEELWYIAGLFGHEKIEQKLIPLLEEEGTDFSERVLKSYCFRKRSYEEPDHLSSYYERRFYKGDASIIKDIKRYFTNYIHCGPSCKEPLMLAARFGYTAFVKAYLQNIPGDDLRDRHEGLMEDTFHQAMKVPQIGIAKLFCQKPYCELTYCLQVKRHTFLPRHEVVLLLHFDALRERGDKLIALRLAFENGLLTLAKKLLEVVGPENTHVECIASCFSKPLLELDKDTQTPSVVAPLPPVPPMMPVALGVPIAWPPAPPPIRPVEPVVSDEPLYDANVISKYTDLQKTVLIRKALCNAVTCGFPHVLAWFVAKKIPLYGFIDPHLKNAAYVTNPLHAAIHCLLTLDFSGQDPKALTRKIELREMVALLLNHGVYDEPDSNGKTALVHLETWCYRGHRHLRRLVEESIEALKKMLSARGTKKEYLAYANLPYSTGLMQFFK